MQQANKPSVWGMLKAVFPATIPVLMGYVFMGSAFGMLLQDKGYGVGWALCSALFVYAGSAQFLMVGLLVGEFDPLTAFLLVFMVNIRHLFYGIAMLEKYKSFGRARYYLIFALSDETFALVSGQRPPEGVGEKAYFLLVAVLHQFYWVAGCVLGGLAGQLLPFSTQGIEFVVTALFVVLLLEQWQTRKSSRVPSLVGLAAPLLCRAVFGSRWFIPAAMAVMAAVFICWRKPLERGLDE